jgi:hypothetical protein
MLKLKKKRLLAMICVRTIAKGHLKKMNIYDLITDLIMII